MDLVCVCVQWISCNGFDTLKCYLYTGSRTHHSHKLFHFMCINPFLFATNYFFSFVELVVASGDKNNFELEISTEREKCAINDRKSLKPKPFFVMLNFHFTCTMHVCSCFYWFFNPMRKNYISNNRCLCLEPLCGVKSRSFQTTIWNSILFYLI